MLLSKRGRRHRFQWRWCRSATSRAMPGWRRPCDSARSASCGASVSRLCGRAFIRITRLPTCGGRLPPRRCVRRGRSSVVVDPPSQWPVGCRPLGKAGQEALVALGFEQPKKGRNPDFHFRIRPSLDLLDPPDGGAEGIEPLTSTMRTWRSSQLSYRPMLAAPPIIRMRPPCRQPPAGRPRVARGCRVASGEGTAPPRAVLQAFEQAARSSIPSGRPSPADAAATASCSARSCFLSRSSHGPARIPFIRQWGMQRGEHRITQAAGCLRVASGSLAGWRVRSAPRGRSRMPVRCPDQLRGRSLRRA